MLKDIEYVLRSLYRNPGFALTAVLSIALAIGANSTIFSYADGLLLRPFPVPDSSHVVVIRSVPPSVSFSAVNGTSQLRMSYPDFEDFRRVNKSFESVVAWEQVVVTFARDSNAPVESRLVCPVSGDFFRAMRIEPQLGRGFLPEEDQVPGRDPVVVLSYDFWKSEFGGNASIIGRTIQINHLTFTVIGVAPASFTGVDPYTQQDFYIPIAMRPKLYASFQNERTARDLRSFLVLGRLKPGIAIQGAAQEAAAFGKSLEKDFPETNRGFGATVVTQTEARLVSLPILAGFVGALFTLALVILLIACANVANLMFARGRGRAREIAVRLAIGGSRARLLRLLLTESVIIALASGALSLVAARWSLRILSKIDIPSDLALRPQFYLDERVLAFTVLVSALSAVLFGLLPALQATRPDLISIIKTGGTDQRLKRMFGSYALVVVQIAGTMILLILTTQGRRNFENVLATNPGFRVDHRITMRFSPEASGYSPEKTRLFYEQLVDRATEVPGIKSAALTSGLPLTYDPTRVQVIPEGYEFPPGRESVQILSYIVDHHYFDTFAVPIRSGRGFLSADRAETSPVAVVNEAFAKEYLGTNPIGKRMRLRRYDRNGQLTETQIEIVGVTMTGKTFLLTEPPAQVVYLPFSQNFRDRMTFIAETAGNPAAMAGPLQGLVKSIDPNIEAFRVRTMDDIFEHSSASLLRAIGRIYDLTAGMGLLMALIGLYAVISYQVSRRTREIGIRVALGAKRSQVVQIFLNHALLMSAAGVSVGFLLGVFANRLSESALGIGNLDPFLAAFVSLSLLLTSLAAAFIPARRASRIDPQHALREH